jgi:hypothetical protein
MELSYCDEGTWVVYDCDEACRDGGYEGAEACEFDEEYLHDICFCY